jgi:hypothetical protein
LGNRLEAARAGMTPSTFGFLEVFLVVSLSFISKPIYLFGDIFFNRKTATDSSYSLKKAHALFRNGACKAVRAAKEIRNTGTP